MTGYTYWLSGAFVIWFVGREIYRSRQKRARTAQRDTDNLIAYYGDVRITTDGRLVVGYGKRVWQMPVAGFTARADLTGTINRVGGREVDDRVAVLTVGGSSALSFTREHRLRSERDAWATTQWFANQINAAATRFG